MNKKKEQILNSNSTSERIWEPSEKKINSSNLLKFIKYINVEYNIEINSFNELYQWSINNSASDQSIIKFWSSIWNFTKINSNIKGNIIVKNFDSFENVEWFPESKINFAENLLKKNTNDLAIIFNGENQVSRRMSWNNLYQSVSKLQQFMLERNLKQGDRAAFFISNIPEAIVILLAAASLGVVCTFCSPDFGVQGMVERFTQVNPLLFIYSDCYLYNGKKISNIEKIKESLKFLTSVKFLIEVPYFNETKDKNTNLDIKNIQINYYNDIINIYNSREIYFEKLPFNHPLYIMYSSGTTGSPKCIVHGAGGTLIQHLKEHQLHCDMKSGDKVFYYTTCGWMMWQWLVSALASECTILLYDGSPFYPNVETLFKYMEEEEARFFGVSAKYLDFIKKSGFIPNQKFLLRNLDIIASTGSPLVDESFDFVYSSIKKDVCLASMSGGTDIISCFVLGNPIGDVYRGEIQTCGLGMRVEVYNELGESVIAQKGELVCTLPFPSQPIYFWNDTGNIKYHNSYFEKYNNVWRHGDWIEIKPHGGIVIYGRSDSTLNPGGVRIGTAEIYRQVEQFPEILESIVVDQIWKNDTRIVLFVKLQNHIILNNELITAIKLKLKENCSPRHVPSKVIAIPDIPRTKSGKIVEIAVKNIINKQEVRNIESMANPEVLKFYENLAELNSD